MSSILKLVVVPLTMFVVGTASDKAVEFGWKSFTGEAAPDPDDQATRLWKLLIFTVISAIVGTSLRYYVTRSVNRFSEAKEPLGDRLAENSGDNLAKSLGES